MSGSQACRGSLHGPIEKEMCHLKAEKNKIKSFCMFPEPDTISLFCLLMLYVFSFYSITPLCPHYVCSNPIIIIFSVDGHHFAFFIWHSIIIVTFAIRNKAALRTLMQIYLAVYMALHIFFLARFARSVFKTLIKCFEQSDTSTNSYIT